MNPREILGIMGYEREPMTTRCCGNPRIICRNGKPMGLLFRTNGSPETTYFNVNRDDQVGCQVVFKVLTPILAPPSDFRPFK